MPLASADVSLRGETQGVQGSNVKDMDWQDAGLDDESRPWQGCCDCQAPAAAGMMSTFFGVASVTLQNAEHDIRADFMRRSGELEAVYQRPRPGWQSTRAEQPEPN